MARNGEVNVQSQWVKADSPPVLGLFEAVWAHHAHLTSPYFTLFSVLEHQTWLLILPSDRWVDALSRASEEIPPAAMSDGARQCLFINSRSIESGIGALAGLTANQISYLVGVALVDRNPPER
jgi:hypothetical protein